MTGCPLLEGNLVGSNISVSLPNVFVVGDRRQIRWKHGDSRLELNETCSLESWCMTTCDSLVTVWTALGRTSSRLHKICLACFHKSKKNYRIGWKLCAEFSFCSDTMLWFHGPKWEIWGKCKTGRKQTSSQWSKATAQGKILSVLSAVLPKCGIISAHSEECAPRRMNMNCSDQILRTGVFSCLIIKRKSQLLSKCGDRGMPGNSFLDHRTSHFHSTHCSVSRVLTHVCCFKDNSWYFLPY